MPGHYRARERAHERAKPEERHALWHAVVV